METKDKKLLVNICLLLILTIFVFLIRISIGNSIIPLKTVLSIFFKNDFFNTTDDANLSGIYNVIKNIRIPLFFSSFLIGAILSASGLVMQTILKNPLAEPYTLGISAGASFGCSLAIFLSSTVLSLSIFFIKITWIFAIFFGILSALLIFFIALKTGSYTSSSLIISGIIVNSFFTAAITILFYLLGQKVNLALSWMMGIIPIADKNWIIIAIIEFSLLLIYFSFHKEFDILTISESSEINIGLNLSRFKQVFFLISAIGVSLIVSQSGIIPFIGIIVPYLLKLNPKNHFKQNLIYSIFFGGNFLVFVDILSYLIPSIFKSNIQLPIGAVTGFLGAPFFLFLLLKRQFK